MSAPRKHAKYNASGMQTWAACPGSTRLAGTVGEQPSSTYADDGTEAHDLLTYALENNITSARVASMQWNLDVTRSTRIDDEDRFDAVDYALNYVYELLASNPGASLAVEQHFSIPSMITTDAGGYNDIAIYAPAARKLYVIDYKHGANVFVPVENNLQLQTYGLGALASGRYGEITEIVLIILQPRSPYENLKIQTWSVTPEHLWAFLDEFDEAVMRCEMLNAPRIPGEKQCRWCPAKTICPEYQKRGLSLLGLSQVREVTLETTLPAPEGLTPAELGRVMIALDSLDDLIDAFRKAVDTRVRNGEYIPGWKLVEAQARTKWYGDQYNIGLTLAASYDVPLTDVLELKSISAVRDILVNKIAKKFRTKKAATEAINEALADYQLKATSGNLTVVREEDKRPAVNVGQRMLANYTPVPPTTG